MLITLNNLQPEIDRLIWNTIPTTFNVPNLPKSVELKTKLLTRFMDLNVGKSSKSSSSSIAVYEAILTVSESSIATKCSTPTSTFVSDAPREAELSPKLKYTRLLLSNARLSLWRKRKVVPITFQVLRFMSTVVHIFL